MSDATGDRCPYAPTDGPYRCQNKGIVRLRTPSEQPTSIMVCSEHVSRYTASGWAFDGPPAHDQPCDPEWCASVCHHDDEHGWVWEDTIGGEGSDSTPEQDLLLQCLCDHHTEHECQPETEDIADGVVNGGMAHVYRTHCTICDQEMEPEEDPR